MTKARPTASGTGPQARTGPSVAASAATPTRTQKAATQPAAAKGAIRATARTTAAPTTAAPTTAAPTTAAPTKAGAKARAEITPRTNFELYLLRHADAGDPAKWTGDDAERPLSRKGSRQTKRLGRHLKSLDMRLDAVITSPKLRAAETARPVARSIGADLSTDERLGLEFGSEELTAVLAGLPPDIRGVMLVGHDPDFSELASWLVGSSIEMRKGALVRIDLPDRALRAGRGSLRWLLPPDVVSG